MDDNEFTFATFHHTFEFLTSEEEGLGITPESAAYAMAQANAHSGIGTWDDGDFPIRELHRLTLMVSGAYRVVV